MNAQRELVAQDALRRDLQVQIGRCEHEIVDLESLLRIDPRGAGLDAELPDGGVGEAVVVAVYVDEHLLARRELELPGERAAEYLLGLSPLRRQARLFGDAAIDLLEGKRSLWSAGELRHLAQLELHRPEPSLCPARPEQLFPGDVLAEVYHGGAEGERGGAPVTVPQLAPVVLVRRAIGDVQGRDLRALQLPGDLA
jgi:hypothetical protein